MSELPRVLLILFGLSLLPVCDNVLLASDSEGLAFFEQKIRPVFIEHCYSCHSEKAVKLRTNLFLDSKAGWEKGGDSGEPAIVPGHPERSPLIASVQHLDLVMPPDKPKLPDAVIADLVTWIQMGAPDPRDGKIDSKRGDKSWWSFQPIPAFAADENELSSSPMDRNAIDLFVGKKLEVQGLKQSPPADARTLIRRMHYDLTGLPPTQDEVSAFIIAFRENADAATKQLIERLLSSSHYGERWGRHWLDVVRFGESHGFERNVINDQIWPFRDYVIRSINEDKPFDAFIQEHMAGDVIGKGNPDIEVGSAFLVAGPYDDVGNSDPVAAANIRAATLDDSITATSSAFLGLTINCARCHDHKFDPIPTEDYYRIRAAFEGVLHGQRTVATQQQEQGFHDSTQPLNREKTKLNKERKEIEKVIEERAKQMLVASTRPKIDVVRTEESFSSVEARYLKFVMHASTSNPKSAVGSRLTEFQVWSDDSEPVNVALASTGTKAEGARSAVADDFSEAYGPQLSIDGALGEQWFVGAPAALKLTFSRPIRIQKISFMNDKDNEPMTDKNRGATPTDYDIQISMDGETWMSVASSEGREPWSAEHAIERSRIKATTAEERLALEKLDASLADLEMQIRKIPPLQQVWVGKHEQPKEPTFVHKGGDPMKPLAIVAPSGLSVLDRVLEPYVLDVNAAQSERRLSLAKWITHDANPLTARVLANRVWQHHFGAGIVDTPSDFGFLGSRPTHPELLDYLARRLIQNGWQLNNLHREILNSKTYRQASQGHGDDFEAGIKKDKSARLLWRFPPRRLSAEEVRDTLLMVAGKLDTRMAGPGFRLYKFSQNNVCTYFPLDQHGPETYRRAVYHQNARASVVDVLNDFDLPDISFSAPKRSNTTTPLQALTLLNHSFTQDMASAYAKRLLDSNSASSVSGQITDAYAVAFQRLPDEAEATAASDLIRRHGLNAFCRALLNSNELIFIE